MVVWLLRFNLEKGSKGERRMISRKNERI